MKLPKLLELLKALGYPVAFSHFNEQQTLPYITYTTPSNDDFVADNINYHKIMNVDIELYTDKKDLVVEEQIEDLLIANELPYTSYQTTIKEEDVFQKVYEITLI